MLSFWKKRRAAALAAEREAEQQRRFEEMMIVHEDFMEIYRCPKPISLADELRAVAASYERASRDSLS